MSPENSSKKCYLLNFPLVGWVNAFVCLWVWSPSHWFQVLIRGDFESKYINQLAFRAQRCDINADVNPSEPTGAELCELTDTCYTCTCILQLIHLHSRRRVTLHTVHCCWLLLLLIKSAEAANVWSCFILRSRLKIHICVGNQRKRHRNCRNSPQVFINLNIWTGFIESSCC